MLTTCPECQTTFRVDQAQLDARRGMVRCGSCSAIFNAYDTLLPELEPPPSDVQIVVKTAIESKRAAEQDKKHAPSEPTFVLKDIDLPLIAEMDAFERNQRAASGKTATSASSSPFKEVISDRPRDDFHVLTEDFPEEPDTRLSDELEAAFAKSLQVEETTSPDVEKLAHLQVNAAEDSHLAAEAAETSDTILLSELHDHSKPAEPRAIWHVLGYSVASLVLLGLFLAQLAYFLRAEIVTYEPGMRAQLESACQLLGCTVPLSRHKDAVRVESSTLETDPEQPSRARLRVSFSNRSNAIQAWPHFLLKLTDTRNAPLAQRAFAPAEYLPEKDDVRAGMRPMSEMEFQLALDFGSLSAAGYEVKPHYP